MRAGVPRQAEDYVGVYAHDGAVVGVGEGLRGVADLDPRAVYQDADCVAVGEDAGDQAGYVVGVGEVCGVDVGLAAECFDGGFGFG